MIHLLANEANLVGREFLSVLYYLDSTPIILTYIFAGTYN